MRHELPLSLHATLTNACPAGAGGGPKVRLVRESEPSGEAFGEQLRLIKTALLLANPM
jgi:hypothetical protein